MLRRALSTAGDGTMALAVRVAPSTLVVGDLVAAVEVAAVAEVALAVVVAAAVAVAVAVAALSCVARTSTHLLIGVVQSTQASHQL
jgi:hypothetical protein